ncbi:MAG: DUF1573 domain-containing protein [Thiohalospira sp.]
MRKFKLLISYLALIFMIAGISNNISFAQSDNGPKFEFLAENNRMYLDTIYLDWIEDVTLDIEFVNKGDKPLVVQKVTGCCGTQITDWTKKPLLPGETGTIKLEFRVPPRPHKISRTVRAVTNDPGGAKTLHIIGVVAEPKEEGTIQLNNKES